LDRDSFKEKDGALFCVRHFGVRFCPRCAACALPILEVEFSRALNQSWHAACFACQFCRKALESEYVCDASQLPYCNTSCYIAQINRLKQQQNKASPNVSPNSSAKTAKLAVTSPGLLDGTPLSPTSSTASSSSSPTASLKVRKRVPKSNSPPLADNLQKPDNARRAVESDSTKTSPAKETTAAAVSASATSPTPPVALSDVISPRTVQRLKVKQRRPSAPVALSMPLLAAPSAPATPPPPASSDAYVVTRDTDLDFGNRECEQCKANKVVCRLLIDNGTVKASTFVCGSCAERIEANRGKLEPVKNSKKTPDDLNSKKAKRQDAKVAKRTRRHHQPQQPAPKAPGVDKNRTFDASELQAMYANVRGDIAAAEKSAGKRAARTTDDVPRRPAAAARTVSRANLGVGAAASSTSVGPTSPGKYEIHEETFITDLDAIALAAIRKKQAALLKASGDSTSGSSSGSQISALTKPTVSARERLVFAELRDVWNKRSPKVAMAKVGESGVDSSPIGVAKFLLVEHERLDKVTLGEMLGREEAPWRDVLREFLRMLSFKQHDFLFSLRRMIAQFRLPGEGQVINRIMETFAKVYCEQNRGFFKDPDQAHTLALLVLTLNTATHNPSEQRKISIEDWVSYCEELTAHEPRCTPALLEAIWQSIQDQEIRMPMEGMFPEMVRRGFLELCEGTFARSWKSRWFVLSHSCLYIFDTPEDEDPRTIVPLHGVTARTSSRRANAFELAPEDPMASLVYTEKSGKESRLKQGKLKSLLFAAASEKERDIWMADIEDNKINVPTAVPFDEVHDDGDAAAAPATSADGDDNDDDEHVSAEDASGSGEQNGKKHSSSSGSKSGKKKSGSRKESSAK
jgi:hypothetical protein